MPRLIRSSVALLCIFTLASCNIWAPFTSTKSANDRLEAALKCHHNLDIDCAIENYDALPAGTLRFQKLCFGYLVKTGLTLTFFLSLSDGSFNSSQILGTLANEIAPWTSDKGTAGKLAYDNCKAYSDANPNEDLGNLLRVMGAFTDCAARMAKSDLFHATSEETLAEADDNGASCATVDNANSNGTIEQADLGGDATTGVVSAAAPGMCKPDVDKCQTVIVDLSTTSAGGNLNLGEISNIEDAFNQLPPELQSQASVTGAVRKSLKDNTIAN